MKKIVIPAALAAVGLAAVAAAAVIYKRKRAENERKPYGAWRK